VMELWPDSKRGVLAGLIGAAANVGFLTIALIGLILAQVTVQLQTWLVSSGVSASTVDYLCRNQGWRLMMMIGAAPALLTFLIRLFVPESEKWQHAKAQGSTSAWQTRDLIAVFIGAAGPLAMVYLYLHDFSTPVRLIGTIAAIVIACIGYSYPVLRYLQRTAGSVTNPMHTTSATMRRMLLAACLSGVALLGTWGALQLAVPWVSKMTAAEAEQLGLTGAAASKYISHARSMTQIWSAIGAIVGTMIGGLLGHTIGRRPTYFILCVASLLSSWWFFLSNTGYNTNLLVTVTLAGATTASFYGWLPLYLPELFRTSARATGQGFAFNFGRILAAVGALQTANLIALFNTDTVIGGFTFRAGHPTACSIISLVYVIGMVLIWFMPETHGKELPE